MSIVCTSAAKLKYFTLLWTKNCGALLIQEAGALLQAYHTCRPEYGNAS